MRAWDELKREKSKSDIFRKETTTTARTQNQIEAEQHSTAYNNHFHIY